MSTGVESMGKNMKSNIVIIGAVLLSLVGVGLNCGQVGREVSENSTTIEIESIFSAPRLEKVGDTEYYSIKMEDTQKYYDRAGLPLVPFRTAMIPIPQGRDVKTINVVPGKKVVMEGRFKIEYARQQLPSRPDQIVETQPDTEVYNSSNPFPGQLYSVVSTQYQRGTKILILNVYPVQYVPRSGEIWYYQTMKVIVTTVAAG